MTATPCPSEVVGAGIGACVSEPATCTTAPGITAPLGSCTTTRRAAPDTRCPAYAAESMTRTPRATMQADNRLTDFTRVPLPSVLRLELLRVDLRIDFDLADRPLL